MLAAQPSFMLANLANKIALTKTHLVILALSDVSYWRKEKKFDQFYEKSFSRIHGIPDAYPIAWQNLLQPQIANYLGSKTVYRQYSRL
jgi:hypothetical protein